MSAPPVEGFAKRVLMVAFHFPPQRGSSGIQRTLKFAQLLPASGWQPLVLSAHPRAYDATSDDQLKDIAPNTVVRRAFALNTRRHISWRGRYLGFMAVPDRWISWWLGAVPAGLGLLRRYRPDVIWSTYPIASAHLIGMTLSRLSGVPWVADMRDPMADEVYPAPGLVRRAHCWIEAQTVQRAAAVVCTTPGAVALYRARYPQLPPTRFRLIENAYDEEQFVAAQTRLAARVCAPKKALQTAPLRLLHSGVVYPLERDPRALFTAVATLKKNGAIDSARVRIILRASGHDEEMRALIAHHGIGTIVSLAPPLPYGAALEEMLEADGLLILQAANCNQQVPAKLYEYMRARRPVLALTDAAGDTSATLRAAGIDNIAALDDAAAIATALLRFVKQIETHTAPLASDATIGLHARTVRAQALAALLDEVSARRRATSR